MSGIQMQQLKNLLKQKTKWQRSSAHMGRKEITIPENALFVQKITYPEKNSIPIYGIQNISAGVYYVRVETEKVQLMKKLIIAY